MFELENNKLRLIQNGSMDIYQQVFNLTRFSAQQTTGLIFNAFKFDKKTLLMAITNPINGLKLSDTLKKHRTQIIDNLNIALAQQIQTGAGYREVAKQIKSIFNGDEKKALKTVWTENHRVKELSKFDSEIKIKQRYPDLKITKVWDSTKDSRTRPDHVIANGQKRELEKNFNVGQSQGLAPGSLYGIDSASQNINCRCAVFTEYNGEVPPDFNDKEWKDYMKTF